MRKERLSWVGGIYGEVRSDDGGGKKAGFRERERAGWRQ